MGLITIVMVRGYQPGVVSYIDTSGNYVNYTINQTQGSAKTVV